MGINEIIETPGLAENLSDEDVKKLAYGIKFFDIGAAYTRWGNPAPDGAESTIQYLRNRLSEIENSETKIVGVEINCNGTRYDEKCEICYTVADVCNTCGICENCHE